MRYLRMDGVVSEFISREVVIGEAQAHTLLRLATLFDPETGRLDSLKRLLDTWDALSKMGMIGRVMLVVLAGIASLVWTTTQILAYLHPPRN